MQAITTIGLDIAKSVFQVHAVDAEGNVVFRRHSSADVGHQCDPSASCRVWHRRIRGPQGRRSTAQYRRRCK